MEKTFLEININDMNLKTKYKINNVKLFFKCAPVGLNSLRRNSQNVELDKISKGELTPSLETVRRVGDGKNLGVIVLTLLPMAD
ncbi:hypothetical protein OUZ56_008485 [Daphnia magna]|uniref:Uncharacterized protein n=1 Tax=Daphnia magna TaxID=35525 RepID=A0ABR0ADJ0_9CRUS|nr:hypothetical protein OUZ56_008485 [Daphnia magna]